MHSKVTNRNIQKPTFPTLVSDFGSGNRIQLRLSSCPSSLPQRECTIFPLLILNSDPERNVELALFQRTHASIGLAS